MPYIDPIARIYLAQGGKPRNKGELNYAVTMLVIDYITRRVMSYAVLSDARAALQDANDELYRRLIAPYEDTKAALNGDVFAALVLRTDDEKP